MRPIFLTLIILLMATFTQAQDLHPARYADGDQVLNGWFAGAGETAPGVLILPAWMGVDDEARTAAVELAKQGYVTFIADIYGEGKTPTTPADARAASSAYKQDFAAYQHRINLGLEQLVQAGADPDKLAVIGYCFGGTGALETARGGLPVQGVVCIHGGLAKGDRPDGPLSTRILILHPDADASVSAADLQAVRTEMNAAKADWQLISYAHCGHTFTNPASKDYNAVMAARAWQHTLLFLDEVLR